MLTNWGGQKETSPVSGFKDSLEVFLEVFATSVS